MMNSIQLYRNGNPTITVPIDENTVYFDECMGRFDITLNTASDTQLDIKVDDYILWEGIRFTINVAFQHIRGAGHSYSITFEHPSRALTDIIFKHMSSIEFSYYGTPSMFIDRLIECMNADDLGWQRGQVDTSEERNINFYASGSGYTCRRALMLIAETFGLEFWFSGEGKTINLTKQAGVVTNIDFEYGRSKGLYQVERGVTENPLYNRLYIQGGTKNIPTGYRGGIKRLAFTPGYIERPLQPGEKRRESSIMFDDIFPERTALVTAVSTDGLSLTDTSLDFDINGNRIDGQNAYVLFKSGSLAGVEVEIAGYNHTSKTIRVKPNTETDGYTLPSDTRKPAVGDRYTLIGIRQPESYITNAEARLITAGTEEFKKATRPPYRVEIDEKYMRENGFKLRSGDRVRLRDSALGVDDQIRITSVSFPLVNPQKCTVVISDKVTYTQDVQVVIDQGKIKEDVKVVDKNLSEYNRKQSAALSQFQNMVFDPDGNLSGTLQALMIQAMSGLFGADSQNFDLEGIFIKANADGNANKITFTAGTLVHHKYEIEGLGYRWQMEPLTRTNLDPTKAYYISARCSRSELTGVWVLSVDPIGVNDVPGYWHFNLGTISSVIVDQRFTNITKGFTFITGGQILTERLIAQLVELPYMTIGRNGENVQNFYYDLAKTKIAVSFGVVNGKPQLVWYDETTGNEIWNASKNGIVYVTNTSESWSTARLLLMHNITTEGQELDELGAKWVLESSVLKDGPDQVYVSMGNNRFYYDAGKNDFTETNIVYEGYHTSQEKTAPFVPNGYYYITSAVNPGDKEYLIYTGDFKYRANVVKIWNGKMKGGNISVEIEVY